MLYDLCYEKYYHSMTNQSKTAVNARINISSSYVRPEFNYRSCFSGDDPYRSHHPNLILLGDGQFYTLTGFGYGFMCICLSRGHWRLTIFISFMNG